MTSNKNPDEDFVKQVLAAFEAGNKSVVKPITFCGKNALEVVLTIRIS